jgi:hypothetical protein
VSFYKEMIKAVALLLLLAAPAAFAQLPRAPGAAADSVLISRRALTFSFALASADSTAKARELMPGVNVVLAPDGRDPVQWFKLHVAEPVSAATYRSPLRPLACRVMTDTYSCRDSSTVEVANGRVVITIRDSAMLALMFAERPTKMLISSVIRFPSLDRPVVRYVDPQLQPPSKEALIAYDDALARDRWGPWTRMMWTSSAAALDSVWMQVGQRITASLGEMQCRPIDSCNWRSDFSASGWTSSDSSVAALELSNDPRRVSATIVARRPGRSTVAVEGLRGPSDDLPRSTRIRTIARHIVVTNRLVRIQITPRPTTITAGSPVKLEAQLIDETGVVVAGAPVNFLVIYDWPDNKDWGSKRYGLATRADLATPGHRRFIAYFANLADTLDLQIVSREARRPPRIPWQ